jgi:hypothetical protein
VKILIPIFRAKKIDGGEYVEGYLNELIIPDIEIIDEENQRDITRVAFFISGNTFDKDVACSKLYCGKDRFNYRIDEENEIDISTLSIHMPDILDSEGTKIFASLSEDGKGGDTFKINGKDNTFDIFVAIFQGGNGLYLLNTTDNYRAKGAIHPVHRLITKVTGIYND